VTTLKLHYDGWLALPADFRRKLGLGKGQALEAQLVGGTIVLRPAGMKAVEAVEVEVEPEPAPAVMEPAAAEAPAKPRARRKQATTATTATATLPPALKSRGRKARAADGAQGS
jgi:bifunctional DNA-binding transcriptional regulator/antitoxin component of YhaV-PrlF toxin-antitoxin module